MSEALSSNHFSTDLQIADVVSFVERKFPDDYRALVAEFPELPKALATLSGWSAWVDTDELGLDPEFMSWVADWIEERSFANSGTVGSYWITWLDGEPFGATREDWDNPEWLIGLMDSDKVVINGKED
jgi:hypothetical protein